MQLTGLCCISSLHPYYTSDATTADRASCLRRLAASPGSAARLHAAAACGRLAVVMHWYACAPFAFHHLPPDLAAELAAASVVLLKVDPNYRRLVGDCHWPATTSFANAAAYFPAPVVALRTLKSDVVVGMEPVVLVALDADSDNRWRINRRYALVQAHR